MGVASAPKYPKLLEDWTWAQIAEVADRGEMQKYHSIGDEKTITLTTGEVITVRIEDFDHDDLADASGKANVTFGMKDLSEDIYAMNSTDINSGGWYASSLRELMFTLFLPKLPYDLQNSIKEVIKRTTAGNRSTTIINSRDNLWLFSSIEVGFNAESSGYMDEGEPYPLFTDASSRIKNNPTGIAASYHLRSPLITNNTNFLRVANIGGVQSYLASASTYICFGFCI